MAEPAENSESNPFWEPDAAQQPASNPFDEETSALEESIDSLLVSSGNRTPVPLDSRHSNLPEGEEKAISWEQVANHLLKKNFHLTALELHTELHERGIQLPRLRDFFSNPGNFEYVRESTGDADTAGAPLNRASSSQTLDSLDFHRDSSEDDIYGRVDERVAVLEFELRKAKDIIQSLREHLTNLTGSPEPSANPSPSTPKAGGTLAVNGESAAPIQPLEKRALNFLVNEYLLANEYKLTSITFTDECQNLDFDDWDDVGLNIPKPPGIVSLYRKFRCGGLSPIVTEGVRVPQATTESCCQTDIGTAEPVITDNALPVEQLKVLQDENERLTEELRTITIKCDVFENELHAARTHRVVVENHVQPSPPAINYGGGDGGVQFSATTPHPVALSPRLTRFTAELRRILFPPLTTCDPENQQILSAISRISTDQTQAVSVLAETLPQIIPNVLLAKRQEVIPLLLVTILLHEDHGMRDKLLHQLFNLLKKPEDQQRRMILNGCERFAALAPAERLEGELLPQCWTQISHKYAERRMLVAESCAILASYVSPEICGSLIISMLKQMVSEDKNPDVREKVVQSLAVVSLHITDSDKFHQLLELLHICMKDSSELVVKTTLSLYLPSLAIWTQTNLNLGARLIEPYFVKSLSSDDATVFTTAVTVLRKLIPNIYADVVNTGPWRSAESDFMVDDAFTSAIQARLPRSRPDDMLESLQVLIGEDYVLQCAKFHSYIDREWFHEWPQYKWIIEIFVPSLCKCAASLHISNQDSVTALLGLFKHLILYFGDNFATSCLSKCMKGTIQELGSSFLYHAVFVCFSCAVVALCDPKQLQEFLSSALVSISDQALPLDGMQLIFRDLADRFPDDLTQVCWTGIVHHSVPVRLNAARLMRTLTELFRKSHSLLEPLIPPLITLASDHESRIRLEIIPSLANVLKEHVQEEKLLTVFQGFLDDREHLDIVDNTVRELAKSAIYLDKRFHQEFLLPRLAVLVAQNPRLQVYRKDMAICLLDAYVSLSCASFGEESWLVAPVLQSVRSLLQELKELNMVEYVDIAQELSDKLARTSYHQTSPPSLPNPDEIKAKVMNKIKDSGLTTMFKKK
ncbi:RAB11-binding protein RELCH homolog [Paramacrobiotus metropolitanus]|uniref:RAB11-binding protein RELCH homolog n=1 Tax=Paramacrobiotus metropolitanus TaxID=2943436 RepID=UPI002445F5A1|nr:RAB11-binding protein RELCH homolog [Paramacrobiotus metropolitanus]